MFVFKIVVFWFSRVNNDCVFNFVPYLVSNPYFISIVVWGLFVLDCWLQEIEENINDMLDVDVMDDDTSDDDF